MRLLLVAALILIAGSALADEPPAPQQSQGPCSFGSSNVKVQIMGVDPEMTACQMALLRVELSQANDQKIATGALKLKADAEIKALQAKLDWYTEDDAGLRAMLPKDAPK